MRSFPIATTPHSDTTAAASPRWPYGIHLLVVGVLACLTIPRAAQLGMFVDGVTYAAIARNMAIGVGSLWQPHYTATLYPVFHEQPPLGMALQALWFAILGDTWWVDRVYALGMFGITAVLIVLLWRRTVGARGFAWLPLLFWLLPSPVTWAAVNNMLENAQAVFTTCAVYAFVAGCGTNRRVWWGMSAGSSVVAAVLVKGPVGLFPLFAPVALALAMPSQLKSAGVAGAAMLSGAAATAGACVALGAVPAIVAYANQHLLPTIAGPRGSESRLSNFTRHLATGTLLRMGALLGLLALIGRRSGPRDLGAERSRLDPAHRVPTSSWAMFFGLLALAASVPIAFSGRIAGHYFVPAIPMYGLAFGAVALSFVSRAQAPSRGAERVRLAAGTLGIALLLASVLVPVLVGPLERRDTAWVQAFQILEADVPRAQTFGTCRALVEDWALHAYLQRFFRVSLDAVQPERHQYFWQLAGVCELPASCNVLNTAPPFTLARCNPPTQR